MICWVIFSNTYATLHLSTLLSKRRWTILLIVQQRVFVLFVTSFEANASEGLSYMHSVGIVHCHHKQANILVCRRDDPAGFVGKVADPGFWCGESGFGNEHLKTMKFRKDNFSVVFLSFLNFIIFACSVPNPASSHYNPGSATLPTKPAGPSLRQNNVLTSLWSQWTMPTLCK